MTDRQTDRQTHIWIIKNSPVSKNVRREEKDRCEKTDRNLRVLRLSILNSHWGPPCDLSGEAGGGPFWGPLKGGSSSQ